MGLLSWLFGSKKPPARRAARPEAGIPEWITWQDSRGSADAIPSLQSPDTDLQYRAACGLRSPGSPEEIDEVLAALAADEGATDKNVTAPRWKHEAARYLCECNVLRAVVPLAKLVAQGNYSVATWMTHIGPELCVREIISWCQDGHPESWGLLADYLYSGSGDVARREQPGATTHAHCFAVFGKTFAHEMHALLQEIGCHLSAKNLGNLARVRDAEIRITYSGSVEPSSRQVLVDFSPVREFAAAELARRKGS